MSKYFALIYEIQYCCIVFFILNKTKISLKMKMKTFHSIVFVKHIKLRLSYKSCHGYLFINTFPLNFT